MCTDCSFQNDDSSLFCSSSLEPFRSTAIFPRCALALQNCHFISSNCHVRVESSEAHQSAEIFEHIWFILQIGKFFETFKVGLECISYCKRKKTSSSLQSSPAWIVLCSYVEQDKLHENAMDFFFQIILGRWKESHRIPIQYTLLSHYLPCSLNLTRFAAEMPIESTCIGFSRMNEIVCDYEMQRDLSKTKSKKFRLIEWF